MTTVAVDSPYRGLRPFEDSQADALLFFGRELETELIAANLRAARLTVLYGPSGVGKSSVLRAGVMHQLRAEDDLVVRFESWSGNPVAGIAEAVRAAVSDRLGEPVEDVGGSLATRLGAWSGLLGSEIYLVLDQVEEYFLYHGRNGKPDSLMAELPDVVNEPGLRVNVLLGIREDALALLDAFKARIPQVLGNYLRLDRLDRSAGEAAILGPLAAWNELSGEPVAAEPELVEALLDEVSVEGGRVEAPYLQVVLERVWEAERVAGSSLLRRSTLARLGGAERIVDDHLELALAGLDGDARDTAAEMFAHLVTPGGTKIAHELGDLAIYAGRDVDDVAAALVRERILRPVDGGSNGGRVEIYHDVLAGAVAEWRLRHEGERQIRAERNRARSRQRRLIATMAVLALGLAAMTGLAVYAFSKRGEARDRAQSAQARELTASSLAHLDVDPELSVLLVLEAAARERSRQVEDALRNALVASKVRGVAPATPPVHAVAFKAGGIEVVDDRRRLLLGAVGSPALSPDGSVLVFARDRQLVVVDGGRERSIPTPAQVAYVAVSADGNAIATLDANHALRVYATGSLRLRFTIRAPIGAGAVALGGDGAHVAVAVRKSILAWSVRSGRPDPLVEDRGSVTALALSHDGQLVALGSADGAARIFERATGRLVNALANHGHHVIRVAFSSDGSRLLTASRDGLVRTWRTEDGHLFAVLRGHGGPVAAASFGADARRVVTGSDDGTVRVWHSGAVDELEPILTGNVPFLDAVLTRDGGVIAADERGIWVGDGRRVEVPRSLSVAALSPDGSTAVGARNALATVWRTHDGTVLGTARMPSKILAGAVGGRQFVLGGADGVAVLRSLDGGKQHLLRGHTEGVTAVGLSPDGAHVATGDGTGVVRLWSSSGGPPLHVLRGHTDLVAGVTFSPDGRTLATASRDRNAHTWNVATGRRIRALVGHFAIVSEASFSPDQRWVVTAGPGTAGLWLRGVGPPGLVRSHSARVMSAAFGPDNVTIVTASRDGTVKSYRCELCRDLTGLASLARSRLEQTGRRLTAAERRRYLGER